ncbi:hypothetical protein Tco_0369829 [Tanacetum coccineum]
MNNICLELGKNSNSVKLKTVEILSGDELPSISLPRRMLRKDSCGGFLLLQEFDIDVRDKKQGAEKSCCPDHHFRLENPHQNKFEKQGNNEAFPLETLDYCLKDDSTPGYSNGENQVVSNSPTVTTADASDKRQQQQDSTSSTSTLATTITADGNFDL